MPTDTRSSSSSSRRSPRARSAPRALTVAQFMQLPTPNGERHELIDGELRTMTPPGFDHGEIIILLGGALTVWSRGRFRAVTNSSFVLVRPTRGTKGQILAPDIGVVRASRVKPGRHPGAFDGSPDVAIEVVSPSNGWKEIHDKVARFFLAGAEMVWVIDPDAQSVRIDYANGPTSLFGIDDTVSCAAPLNGFTIKVRDLFGFAK